MRKFGEGIDGISGSESGYIHYLDDTQPSSSRTCNQPLSACLVRKYRNTSRSRSGSIILSMVSFKNGFLQ
jgi:hypothetical protein